MKARYAYAALMAAEALGRAMAFIVGAAIARVYGLEILAVVTLAQSLSAYVSVTSDGGLNNHALMRLFNRSRTRRVVAETSRAQLIIVLGVTPVVGLIIYLTVDYALALFILFCLVPIATAFSTPYILQYRGDMIPIAVSRLLGALTTAVAGTILIYVAHVPAVYLAIPYVLSAAAMMLTVCVRSKVEIDWYLRSVSWERLKRSFSVVRSLGASALFKQVLLSLPLLLAGNFGTPEEFESMGVVYRLWIVLSLPAAMLATILIPQIARNPQSSTAIRRSLRALVGLSLVVVTIVAAVPELILSLLFGGAAAQYGGDLRIFTLALLPLAVSSVLSCGYIAKKRYAELMWGNGIGIAVLCVSYAALTFLSVQYALSISWVITQAFLFLYLAVLESRPRKKVLAL